MLRCGNAADTHNNVPTYFMYCLELPWR